MHFDDEKNKKNILSTEFEISEYFQIICLHLSTLYFLLLEFASMTNKRNWTLQTK